MKGQLGGVRGFSAALKTAHQDDTRFAFQVESGMLSAHEGGQFLLRDFDKELSWADGREDFLANGLVLDSVGEAFCHAVVHIRVHEGPADFLGGFGNVGFGDRGLSLDALEGFFEAVAEVLEHGEGKGNPGNCAPLVLPVSIQNDDEIEKNLDETP